MVLAVAAAQARVCSNTNQVDDMPQTLTIPFCRCTHRTPFVLAAVFLFFSRCAWSAQEAEYLQKQFTEIDSALSRIPALPEARMKEVEPVNGLFRKLLARYPEVVSILRTNSKGVVVNDVERQGKADALHSNVFDSAWYAGPKKTSAPWYGPLVKENRRPYLVWSRPLSVRMPIGSERFGGVVNFKIDMFACFKDFAAHANGPFEILLNKKSFYYLSWTDNIPFEESDVTLPGNIVLGLRVPKAAAAEVRRQQPASQRQPMEETGAAEPRRESREAGMKQAEADVSVKAEDSVLSIQGEPAAARTVSHGNLWLLFAGAALLLTLIFGAALLVGRGRRRAAQAAGDTGPAAAAAPDNIDIDVPVIETAFSGTREAYKKIPEFTAGTSGAPVPEVEEVSPSKTDREAVPNSGEEAVEHLPDLEKVEEPGLADADRERIRNEERKHAEDEYTEKIRRDVLEDLTRTISAEVRQEYQDQTAALVKEELKEEIRKNLTENEKQELARQVRDELAGETRAALESELRETLGGEVRAELSAQVRAQVEETERERICKKELEALTSIVRQQLIEKEMPALIEAHRTRLSAEIREKVTQSLSAKYGEEAAAALREELSQKVRLEETERILREESEHLRESLRETLVAEEAPSLAGKIRETLAQEMRAKIEAGERDVMRDAMVAEMKASVREELLTTEHDSIRAEQLERLERELYSELLVLEKDKIRATLLDKITSEERDRVEKQERGSIIEAERNRLLAREAHAIREQVRQKVLAEEMQAIRESVKSEIYSETVAAIRSGLDEKYKSAVQEELAGMKEGLGKKARTDLRVGLQEEYRGLMDNVEQLSAFLANSHALQSLGQTVTLLSEEKKKYKYLNLNTAQTESLLDYLKRIHARFNIYLDTLDKSVRELMLKLGSVKNRLDKEV